MCADDDPAVSTEIDDRARLGDDPFHGAVDQGVRVIHSADQDQVWVPLADLAEVHIGPTLQGVQPVDARVDQHVEQGADVAVRVQKDVSRARLFVRPDHAPVGGQEHPFKRAGADHRTAIVAHIVIDKNSRVM